MNQFTQPPMSLEAEEAVLASVLIDRKAYAEVAPVVSPTDFYRTANTHVFEAMGELWVKDKPIDPLTLVEELKHSGRLESAGGLDYIARLLDLIPSASGAEAYAKIVQENAARRRVIEAANNVVADAHEGSMESLSLGTDRLISAIGGSVGGGFGLMKNSLWPALERLEKMGDAEARGVLTGFRDLDNMLVGFEPGDLVVVAGRPSMGKTAFVLNSAVTLALEGTPVALVSLEMNAEAVTLRALASESRIDLQAMRNGRHTPDITKRLANAAGLLNSAPLFIDDNPVATLPELSSKLTRLVNAEGVKLVVIDYLQLMEAPGTENRTQEVSKLTRGLKLLAGRLGVPIIVLSQLSRAVEARRDKRPMMSDLRESGSIEQDADVVMFVYRPEYYATSDEERDALLGLAEVIIGKQRNGPVGSVSLHFTKEYARFDDINRGFGVA